MKRDLGLPLRLGLGVAGAIAGTTGGGALHHARAGHTATDSLGYATTCWTGLKLCRTNYQARSASPGAPGDWLNVRNILQWGHPADFEEEYWDAEFGWDEVAAGPQHFSVNSQPNDTWNYLKDVGDPRGILNNEAVYGKGYGLAYLCNDQQYPDPADWCSPFARPIDIRWAEVYFHRDHYLELTHYQQITTIGHELGHTLGLGHHNAQNALMYGDPLNNPNLAPTGIDTGLAQDCRAGGVPTSLFGIRCIYGWYNDIPPATPTPAPNPTATPTPTGGGGGK